MKLKGLREAAAMSSPFVVTEYAVDMKTGEVHATNFVDRGSYSEWKDDSNIENVLYVNYEKIGMKALKEALLRELCR